MASVHVDLDGMRHVAGVRGWDYRGGTDTLFLTGMRGLLDFLAQQDVTATLFVIVEQLDDPAHRELIQEAVDRGHEIASHTVTHAELPDLPSDRKRREIFDSKQRLEQELGVPVRGFRAPNFAMDRESLELLDDAGYVWDSSIMPGRPESRRLSGAAEPAVPHTPLPGRALFELPMPDHRPLPFPFHPCYSLVLGAWYFRLGLSRARRSGAPLMLLFHMTDFAEPLDAGELPGRLARVWTLSHIPRDEKHRRCGALLNRVREHYELTSTERVMARVLNQELCSS